MVIRSGHPRLPRTYWGEVIYATPGSGKTYVANKYCDVVDGDELLVDAINFVDDGRYDYDSYNGQYDDPREFICAYFAYIRFNRRLIRRIYKKFKALARKAANNGDVVLIGSKDLMHFADRIFLQQEGCIVRQGFHNKKEREEEIADELIQEGTPVHRIDDYLDGQLQQQAKGRAQSLSF